jgi:undecaprenyl-diphosphatase
MSSPLAASATVRHFDAWADDVLERLRGRQPFDAIFSTASHLGDFSVLWHLIGIARAVANPRRARQSVALAAALGVESVVVNQGIKRLFRRTRPTETGDPRFAVRRPSTSSFPSGHASSAFLAATLLSAWGRRRERPLWFGLAAVVALSRVYVRIHHASDVVAGALCGLALGQLARRVLAGGRARRPG